MEWLALSIAVLTLVVVVGLVLRTMPGPPLRGRTLVVHTRKPDDRTLRGVLHAQHADRWVLREAVVIESGGREIALGGLEHVPVGNIAFAQEVEA